LGSASFLDPSTETSKREEQEEGNEIISEERSGIEPR
jgi:hypothetical protein